MWECLSGIESGQWGGGRGVPPPPLQAIPCPQGGGGYWTPTHPPIHPTTTYKVPYNRQNALTSAFGTDSKSPTMAYPGGGLETHPARNSDNPPPPPLVG